MTFEPFIARPPAALRDLAPVTPRRSLDGFGELTPFLEDDAVTDLFVNGAGAVWVDRGHGARPHPLPELDDERLRELAVRLVALGGRHLDEASPCVDVRLLDGIRVHAVLAPVSISGTLLSIRIPRGRALGLDELARDGFLGGVPADTLRALVSRRANLLVTGAGGVGKTTFLGALLGEADPHERIVLIEDVAELRPRHPHCVSLETRQANLEGAGALGLERLLREALRMRPDRLVLGECRGAEIRELLAALNTGHDGGAGTLHANSLDDVPARLEALGSLAGLSPEAIARQAVSAIDVVLHLERTERGRRLRAAGVLEIDAGGRLRTREMAADELAA